MLYSHITFFVYPFICTWILGLLFFWPIVNLAMNMAVQVSLKFHFQPFGVIYPDVELLAYIDYIVVVFNFQQPLHRVTHQ